MMKRTFSTDLPGNYGHLALLLFRVFVAILMLTHGVPKLQRLFSAAEIQFADPYGLGVTTSFVLVVFAVMMARTARATLTPALLSFVGFLFVTTVIEPIFLKQ